MPTRSTLRTYTDAVQVATPWRWQGRVVDANPQTLESLGPPCSMGAACEIVTADQTRYPAEVIGFRGNRVLVMPLDTTAGVQSGDRVFASDAAPSLMMDDAFQGRVLDALGRPIDGGVPVAARTRMPLSPAMPDAMSREPIRTPITTGIRAIDAMLTTGRGQRIGIFGGSGVGKSTLIGMMTRNTSADITVVGLVGERGRELREFVEESLGEGLQRSVVFVATSDQSPLLRMRAAQAATAAAEYFAAQGKHVLLVLDSLTRYAMAAREVGLAAGEPPATKGYTPSVFTHLARLVERAGQFEKGSITAFYTVLMEGDDLQDPIVDSVRSLLDGHIVLSCDLAAEGWYPPIEILDSLSRLMPAVSTKPHQARARTVRRLLAAYARSADLIRIGAYTRGTDPELDEAIVARPHIRAFLEQTADEAPMLEETIAALEKLPC